MGPWKTVFSQATIWKTTDPSISIGGWILHTGWFALVSSHPW
jgi:hypothetical protein